MNADVTIDTTTMTTSDAVEQLFDYLAGGGWLQRGTS
jgi:sulfate adenylyltransferase